MFETSDVCCVKRIFSHGEMLTAVSSGNVVRGRRRLVSSSTEVDHIIDLKDTGAIPEREREREEELMDLLNLPQKGVAWRTRAGWMDSVKIGTVICH
jgi:hypothetical protein